MILLIALIFSFGTFAEARTPKSPRSGDDECKKAGYSWAVGEALSGLPIFPILELNQIYDVAIKLKNMAPANVSLTHKTFRGLVRESVGYKINLETTRVGDQNYLVEMTRDDEFCYLELRPTFLLSAEDKARIELFERIDRRLKE